MIDLISLLGEGTVNSVGMVCGRLIAVAGVAYIFLTGKTAGRTGWLRRRAFRCMTMTVLYPPLLFRLSVTLVVIGLMFDYKPGLDSRMLVLVGMVGTVLTTFGITLTRIVRKGMSGPPTPPESMTELNPLPLENAGDDYAKRDAYGFVDSKNLVYTLPGYSDHIVLLQSVAEAQRRPA